MISCEYAHKDHVALQKVIFAKTLDLKFVAIKKLAFMKFTAHCFTSALTQQAKVTLEVQAKHSCTRV
jgi:hypothetical protein